MSRQSAPRSARKAIGLAAVVAVSAIGTVSGLAASITWNGGGGDNNWSSAANWGGATPANNDALTFSGVTRVINSNNWLSSIGAVTFTTGGFTISGNALTLNGDFTNDGNNIWGINSTLGAARIFTSNSGTLTLSGSITNAGFLTTIAGTGNTLISGVLGGTGGLTRTGTGTLTLSNVNTYTGTTSIAPGGTLSISQDANLGTAPSSATAGSLILDSSGTLATTASFTLNSNRGIKIGPTSGTGAGTIDVASGTILTYGGIITSNGSGTGGLIKSDTGTLVLSGANTYTGDTTIAAGTLQLGNGTAIPTGTGKGNLTSASGSTLDLNNLSPTVNGLFGAGTITNSQTGSVTLTVGSNNQTSTFSGVIQNGSGILALTKTGSGTLTLGGTNTFTGGVTINGGVLQLASAGALNSASPNSLTFGPNAAVGTKLQLNGNSVTVSSLATNASPGTVVVENASANAATLTVNQAANTTFAGLLQDGTGGGALALTKSGSGTLTLSGSNTFTGTTTISAGTLALSGAAALSSTGTVVLAPTAGATLLLNANETIGSLAGGGGTGGNVNLQGFILTTGGANASTTYSGVISGSGSLVETGTGALTLNNANSYAGATTIKNGSITLGITNALPNTTALTLGDGSTNTSGSLILNGISQTLAGLTTAGTGTSNSIFNRSGTAATLTVNQTVNTTFAGLLQDGTGGGALSLTKSGVGTLTLSGGNTYTGTTTITNGTLSVSNLASGGNLGTTSSAAVLGDTTTNTGVLSYTGNSASFTRGLTVNAGGGEIDSTTAGQLLTLSSGNVAASGAFTVGGAGNTSITSNITGTGSLNKTGIGTVTLSGSNNYSGATNLKNGTLVLAVNNTGLNSATTLTLGDATLNTNGVLQLNGYTQTLAGLTTAGSGTLNRVIGGSATLSTLTLNNSGSDTYAGILGGTGTSNNNLALVKTGTGTLTLSGASTYTGATTITAGTLVVSADNNLGASSGTLNIGAATLQVTSGFTSSRTISLTDSASAVSIATGVTYTQAGSLTGSGALNFTGASSSASLLVLTGTSNTYSGGTTIQNGNLVLGATNALPTTSNVTLNGGGMLSLNGHGQTVGSISGVGSVVNGKVTAGTFTINNSSSTTFSGVLGGAGTNQNNFALTKTGTGTLTLGNTNTYSGTTTISAGILQTGIASALPSGSGNGNVVINSPGTLDLDNSSITVNGLSGTGTVTNSGAGAQTLTVGGNNQTSTFSGVIQNGGGGGTLGLIKTGTGTLALSGGNTFTGGVTINAGVLQAGNTNALNSAGTNVVTFGASAAAGTKLQLNGNAITLAGLATNSTPGSPVVENANAAAATLTINNSSNYSYAGVLQDGTGSAAMSLTKSGSGTFTLSGSNTYSGTTTISAGILQLGAATALPSGSGKGNVVINSPGTLDLDNSSISINGLSGTGTITNSQTGTLTFTAGGNNATGSFSGVIQDGSGTLALTKIGNGTLTLTPGSNNAFTGGVTINAGVLQAGNSSALNSAGTNVVTFGLNVASGTKLQLNGNSLTLAGLQTNATTVGSPTVENANAAAATLTLNNSSGYTYAGVLQDGTGGGALSLTKSGSGTLTLSGTNTYSGATTVSSGTLKFGADNTLPSGAGKGDVTVASGATLDLNGRASGKAPINGLWGYGTVTNNTLATTGYITVGTNNASSTFYGSLQNNGTGLVGLVKAGTGTLTLTPGTDNAFTGGVTINAGVIQAGNSNALNSAGTNVVTFGASAAAGTKLQLNGNAITIAGLATNNSPGSPVVENANAIAATLTTNNSSNYTYAGVIQDGTGSAALSLIKSGTGTQTLTGSSTYTGGTTISGGTLAINNDAALGNTSGQLAIGNGTLSVTANIASSPRNIALNNAASTINVSSSVTYTEAGLISGSGMLNINKVGTGVLQISGTANSNSGATTISAGLLDVIATSGTPLGSNVTNNNISVSAGGNLSLSDTSNKGSSQNLTVTSSGSKLGGIGFSNTNLSQSALYGMITTDSTSTNGGVLSINNGINYNTALNMGTFGSGKWFLGSAATGTYSATSLTVGATNTYRLGGGGGTLTISNDVLVGTSNVIVGSGSTNGTGTVVLSSNQDFSGTLTINGGTLSVGADNCLGMGTGVGNIVINGGALSASASFTLATGRGIALGSSTANTGGTLDVASGQTLTYAGIIANNGGTNSLTKTGTGMLAISGGVNTYTGATNINAGTLNFSALQDLGKGATIAFNGGTLQWATGNKADITKTVAGGARTVSTASSKVGTLDIDGNNVALANPISGSGAITIIDSTATSSGSGTLTLNAISTYTGATTITSGTLQVGVAGAIPVGSAVTLNNGASVAGTIDINGCDTTLKNLAGTTGATAAMVVNNKAGSTNTLTLTNAANTSFYGAITDHTGASGGTIALAKTGTFTMTLAGTSNTYSGGTTISAGTLSIAGDGSIGAVPGSATAGSIIITGGATLNASNTFTLNSNRGLAIGPSGATAASIDITSPKILTYNGIIANSGTATGGLTKTNTTGVLVLGGANTYAGDTTVSGGTLKIANAAAIPSGSGKGNLILASGSTLDLNANATTINGLSGVGTVTSGVAGAASITAGANDATGAVNTFTGVIQNGSGTVSLGKTGAGTLTLSGSNTFTGGTTIQNGVVNINASAALGNSSGALTFNSTGVTGSPVPTLQLANTITGDTRNYVLTTTGTIDTNSFSLAAGGTFSGAAGLTKISAGTLTLSNAGNSYSGDTTINGGTLQLGAATAIPSGTSKGNLTVASGSTLDLNNFSPTVNGLSGAGTITNSLTSALTFTAGANNQTSTFSGVIQDGTGTLALTKTGSGTLTLGGTNTYSGNTTVSSGTLQLGVAAAIPSGSGKGNFALNGTLDLAGFSTTLNGLTGSGTVTNSSTTAAILTAGASDQTSTFAGNIQDGTGTVALTKTGLGTLTLSGSNTYSGDTTISTGILQVGSSAGLSPNSAITISPSGYLDVNGFSTSINGLLGTGTVTNNGASAATLTAGGAGGSSTFSGVFQDGNSTLGLIKNGTGTLTLTPGTNNAFTGGVTINAGVLQAGNANALNSAGTNVVTFGAGAAAGTKLQLNGNAVTIAGLATNSTTPGSPVVENANTTAATLTINNSSNNSYAGSIQDGTGSAALSLTKSGAGTLTLSGNNTFSGATTIATGTLAIGSSTGLSPNSTLTINGPSGYLDVNGYSTSINGLSGTGTITNNGASTATLTAGAGTFSGVIQDGSSSLSLAKSGGGTLTLNGINTYSGTTTIANGTVSVANPGAGGNLGSGSSAIVLGDATHQGTLSYSYNADLSYTRGLTVNAGGGEMDITSSGKTLTLQTGSVTTSGTFTLGGAGNAVVNSVISGSGGFNKANTGTLLLAAANTYAGDTTVSAGILQLGNAASLPSSSGYGGNLGLALNTTLDVNNYSVTLNGLSGAGTVTNTAGSPVTLTVGANNAAGNFTGVIQDGTGTTALTKTGIGTLFLSGNNTYSGDTNINGGTLQIGNANALGSSKGIVALGAGGTLDLNNFSPSVNGLSGSGTVTNNSGTSVLTEGANNQSSGFGGNLQDGSGTLGLTKAGSGTLTLSGTNTFSGATTIASGTLSMGSNNALSYRSTLNVNNAGTLDLNGHLITIDGLAGTGSIINNSTTPVTLTTGASGGGGIFGGTINDGTGVIALTKTGTGTVTLSNVNGYSGGTTVTGGLLAITADGTLGAIPGSATPAKIVLNGGGISALNTFTLNANRGIAVGPASGSGGGMLNTAANQTLSYNGIIANNGSGIGSLTTYGLGTVNLGGANTYSGNTSVTAGSLQIGNTNAIPSGSGRGNVIVNATLDLNNTSITVNGLSGSGLVSNTKAGAATLSAGGNDQTSTFDGVIANGNGTTALTKVGTGTLTLTGANSHTGGSTVAAGTLSVSADANLGEVPSTTTPGNIAINGGATLAATSTFTLNANRGIAVGPSGAGNINVASSQTLIYGGSIADNGGSGGLTKNGTGTLVLSGTSSYTGTTTVATGVLTVNGSTATSGSGYVRAGATLTGTGTTGTMTIDSAGTVSPGNSGIGTLGASGGLTLNGDAAFELGTPGASHAAPGTSDRINVSGGIALGGNLNLTDNAAANGQGSLGAGSYKLFTYTTSNSTGSFATVNGLPSYHWALHDVVADKAVYIDLYNYAVATVTPAVDLGRIHAGGTFGTQALTVGNTTAASNYTEALAGGVASVDTGITATGSVSGIAGQATNSSNMVVGISDSTAGQKNGNVGIDFTSQAVNTSGLTNTALARQNVAVTGFAYTGQSVWNVSGSGSWGNNVNAYNNWTQAGGVAGLDGTLSANDTATFGSAISAPATVRLDGANPSLSAVTFNNANSYTLAQGSGGQLTLKGNGGAATVTDTAGSHSIAAPVGLASDANIAVTHSADTLIIAGSISGSGYGLTKSGAGVLTLSGDSTYTGATRVSEGTLMVNGTLANTATSVASGAILGGTGTLGGATTIESGGTHAPGNVGSPGTQTFTTGITYNSGSIFEWSLNASDSNDFTSDLGAYDKVVTPSAVAGSANSEAIFKVVLGTNHFSDVFWDTNRTWTDIFSGSGTYNLASLLPVFGGTDGINTVSANGVVAGEGRFYYTGSSLNWSAVPEPTSALVGMLLGAGLLRRRRTDEHG